MEFGKAFSAVTALQQEAPARRHFGQIGLERARFAGEDQRGKIGQRGGYLAQRCGVGIARQMPRFVRGPAFGGPVARHVSAPLRSAALSAASSQLQNKKLQRRDCLASPTCSAADSQRPSCQPCPCGITASRQLRSFAEILARQRLHALRGGPGIVGAAIVRTAPYLRRIRRSRLRAWDMKNALLDEARVSRLAQWLCHPRRVRRRSADWRPVRQRSLRRWRRTPAPALGASCASAIDHPAVFEIDRPGC